MREREGGEDREGGGAIGRERGDDRRGGGGCESRGVGDDREREGGEIGRERERRESEREMGRGGGSKLHFTRVVD